ncbi:MAG: ribose-5-phosphate isomerase RpiA [Planctomycetaceae bacterium]|nr:ribose-5-phosphate isomerase RpiA [Planctomycetaceae bacterium]
MSQQSLEKSLVGRRAVEEVRDGMLVGLGSGSTAAEFVRALGERIKQGLKIEGVPTSTATETLARSVGIPLRPFESISRVDLTVDGVDEIDSQLRAIKGGGGALLREKVVAAASDRMIAIADSSKLVTTLGRFPLPVEVLPFAAAYVERELRQFGVPLQQRTKPDGSPYLTDQGAYIFDISFGQIADPHHVATTISSLPGLLEQGLFLNEIDELLLATNTQIQHIKR